MGMGGDVCVWTPYIEAFVCVEPVTARTLQHRVCWVLLQNR